MKEWRVDTVKLSTHENNEITDDNTGENNGDMMMKNNEEIIN